jgi:hypothetical protein
MEPLMFDAAAPPPPSVYGLCVGASAATEAAVSKGLSADALQPQQQQRH